jgi:tripartite-type tricarboxylate transporter receptor subunit TctC
MGTLALIQRLRHFLIGGLAVLAGMSTFMDAAQAEWPERQITVVVCFPAGGGADLADRLIQVPLSRALGKPVIVENRGGASGSIATIAVSRMAPDGYTLLGCSSAYEVNPSLFAHVKYDAQTAMEPIAVLGASPNVFVVPATSKFQTMKDVIAFAKANPGRLNWTSPGLGTTPQLSGELLKQREGLDMVHIPFTGAGPAAVAVIAGQVDLYVANYASVTGLLNGGQVRPIAVTSKTRYRLLPNVPTLAELGIKDAESDTFQALFAPAGTPKPIIARLAKELKAILARPEIQEKFDKLGLPVVAEGPEQFRARLAREVPMYKDIIDKAGLRTK